MLAASTALNPPEKWEIYDTITAPVQAASDHAAIYADIDV